MSNPFIWFGLIAVVVIAVVVLWNPYFYFFGGTVNAQLLAILVLVPFLLGLIVGFVAGWRRGRPRAVKP